MGSPQAGSQPAKSPTPAHDGSSEDAGRRASEADRRPSCTEQADQPSSEQGKAASGAKARKRTKTGCLTCRKRRIKCGEERPTCRNCQKSKRECEGYVPRVIFKEPTGAPIDPTQASLFGHSAYSSTMAAASSAGLMGGLHGEGSSYPAIAPRPSPHMAHNPAYDPAAPPAGFWDAAAATSVATDQGYLHIPPDYGDASAPQFTGIPVVPPAEFAASSQGSFPHPMPPTFDSTFIGQAGFSSQTQTSGTPLAANIDRRASSSDQRTISSIPATDQPLPSPSTLSEPQFDAGRHLSGPLSSGTGLGQQQPHGRSAGSNDDRSAQSISQQLASPYGGRLDSVEGLPLPPSANDGQWAPAGQETSYSLQAEPEDDWFDVESDEELPQDMLPSEIGFAIGLNAQKAATSKLLTEGSSTPGVLAAYYPSYVASPLRDPQTAAVFCHFITTTGPLLNVCERKPANPALIFSGRPVPRSQRSLWSYVAPMLALRHQELLHAMLALSSLHIAKLQQSSPTPSLRHYHYALRRVAKCLGNKKKRQDPALLAATMLLGFYEVTTAEHNKWNSHLSGARELVENIPYDQLSRRVERYRRTKEYESGNIQISAASVTKSLPQKRSREIATLNDPQLDRDLINTLCGCGKQSSPKGLNDEFDSIEELATLSEETAESYENHMDLYWWFAKQDMYQSIISGNRLLLPFEKWSRCVPRGPIGKLDRVYGSMDHLILLMARLADFAAKDVSRKKRVARDARKQPSSTTNSSASVSGQTTPRQPPPMYGMMPDPGPVRLPKGFDQEQHDRIATAPAPSDSKPLDAAFKDAEAEWLAISAAFDRFHNSLGPTYQPLSPEHMTPLSTPFGPAIYYRSYNIACVQCLYICGRMILARMHPAMPPAAMAAAGVTAKQTAPLANQIGRICAGVWPTYQNAPLPPSHGAILIDHCMGLFHAGVQLLDPAQRGWTITKLRDVARLTGWQTSALIASGCERAWTRLAELGIGPPYERTMNPAAQDDRIAGRSRDPKKLSERPRDNNDRRFVQVNAGTRVYWAMGILSVEEDMRDLSVDD